MLQIIKTFLFISILILIPMQIYAQSADFAENHSGENSQETLIQAKKKSIEHPEKSSSGVATPVRAAQVGAVADIYEPNNDSNSATPMGLNSTQEGHSITLGDEDWIVFDLEEDSTIHLSTSGESGDTVLELYDEDLTQIDYNDDFAGDLFSQIIYCGDSPLSAGLYYARVTEFHSDDVIDNYTISLSTENVCVPDIYEPDDDFEDATYMDLNSDQTGHSIVPGDDQDWVYFYVDEPSKITLNTFSDRGYTGIWFYDEFFNLIDYDNNNLNSLSTITMDCLSPGLYYAQVVGVDLKEIADYSLGLYADPCDSLYFSSSTSGNTGTVSFADEDILAFDLASGQWSRYFDGSDVGLRNWDVDAFHILDDGNILLSLDRPRTIDGKTYDDSDIIKFTATSLGNRTRGSFSMYFDGSDVQLTKSAEDIDAIALLANGDLVISTLGTARVAGATARDEDMLHFHKTRLGNRTAGTWSLYFDGSDVQLAHKNEDIWAAWIDEGIGQVQLSTYKNYNAGGLSGDSDDILTCDGSMGSRTNCQLSLEWDGDAYGFGGEAIDGYSVGSAPVLPVFSAAADDEDIADESLEDDGSEDILDDDEYTEHLYLPLIER